MTVTVEDGTIVAGANSYVTLEFVRAYAAERGIAVSADDAVLEPKLHMAMDWFEGHTFKWWRVDAAQPLSFPRKGVTIDGVLYPDDMIPPLVMTVIAQATCDAVVIELEPAYAGVTSGALKKKKLDVIEKEYFEPSWSTEQPRLTKLVRMIAPLVGGMSAGRLNVNRV